MKLIKPFLISLLLNFSFVGLLNFFFNAKKQTQMNHSLKENKPFKMKLHLKEDLQTTKEKETLNNKNRLNKRQKEGLKNEKSMNAKRPKVINKNLVREKLGKEKETKNNTTLKPSIISKLKGLIKGKIPYPYAAIVKNMEGKVYYTLVLTSKGQTFRYQMTKSSGHALLDKTVKNFFLKNPLEGKIALNGHQNKPIVITDHIQFKIENL